MWEKIFVVSYYPNTLCCSFSSSNDLVESFEYSDKLLNPENPSTLADLQVSQIGTFQVRVAATSQQTDDGANCMLQRDDQSGMAKHEKSSAVACRRFVAQWLEHPNPNRKTL